VHNKLKYYEEDDHDLMDVNDFRIHLKSPDLVREEISLWEKKPNMLDYLKQEVKLYFISLGWTYFTIQ